MVRKIYQRKFIQECTLFCERLVTCCSCCKVYILDLYVQVPIGLLFNVNTAIDELYVKLCAVQT